MIASGFIERIDNVMRHRVLNRTANHYRKVELRECKCIKKTKSRMDELFCFLESGSECRMCSSMCCNKDEMEQVVCCYCIFWKKTWIGLKEGWQDKYGCCVFQSVCVTVSCASILLLTFLASIPLTPIIIIVYVSIALSLSSCGGHDCDSSAEKRCRFVVAILACYCLWPLVLLTALFYYVVLSIIYLIKSMSCDCKRSSRGRIVPEAQGETDTEENRTQTTAATETQENSRTGNETETQDPSSNSTLHHYPDAVSSDAYQCRFGVDLALNIESEGSDHDESKTYIRETQPSVASSNVQVITSQPMTNRPLSVLSHSVLNMNMTEITPIDNPLNNRYASGV